MILCLPKLNSFRDCLQGWKAAPPLPSLAVPRLVSSVSFLLPVPSLLRNAESRVRVLPEEAELLSGTAPGLGALADGITSTPIKLSSGLIFSCLSILFKARSEIQKLAERNARSNSPCLHWIPYLWSAYPASIELPILAQIWQNFQCSALNFRDWNNYGQFLARLL